MPSNFKFDLSSLRGLALTHDSLILGKVVRPVLLEGFYTFVKRITYRIQLFIAYNTIDMPVEMDSRFCFIYFNQLNCYALLSCFAQVAEAVLFAESMDI